MTQLHWEVVVLQDVSEFNAESEMKQKVSATVAPREFEAVSLFQSPHSKALFLPSQNIGW